MKPKTILLVLGAMVLVGMLLGTQKQLAMARAERDGLQRKVTEGTEANSGTRVTRPSIH